MIFAEANKDYGHIETTQLSSRLRTLWHDLKVLKLLLQLELNKKAGFMQKKWNMSAFKNKIKPIYCGLHAAIITTSSVYFVWRTTNFNSPLHQRFPMLVFPTLTFSQKHKEIPSKRNLSKIKSPANTVKLTCPHQCIIEDKAKNNQHSK